LSLLEQVVANDGTRPLSQICRDVDLPVSTGYRLLAALQQRGFVARTGPGRYRPGAVLIRLGRLAELDSLIQDIGRPLLADLARRTGLTAHLGVFESDMVTYLVKAPGKVDVLTREGMQLEAYCSGIGKVLLAFLPQAESERYIKSGSFVKLTPQTIVEPSDLRRALAEIRSAGFAIDDREIDDNLRCIAAPVRGHDGRVCAAISLSSAGEVSGQSPVEQKLPLLRATAVRIEKALAFRGDPPPGAACTPG
jgi:DNA-binding IclR family transcriptional regulator